jgi:hypothetical protein
VSPYAQGLKKTGILRATFSLLPRVFSKYKKKIAVKHQADAQRDRRLKNVEKTLYKE